MALAHGAPALDLPSAGARPAIGSLAGADLDRAAGHRDPWWGYQRIRGNCCALAARSPQAPSPGSCARTVSSRRRNWLPPRGRSFLRRQAASIVACDFLTVAPSSCNGCMSCSSSSCTPDESTSLASSPTPPVPGSLSKPATWPSRLMRRPAPSGSCSATATASSPEPSMTSGTGSAPRSSVRRSKRRTQRRR
jgi:hypothetical protein